MADAARNAIRFLLDDEEIVLHDVDPNRTVLQWLREDRRRTGTKEGCAEGDCGACAVVVAEREGDGLRYRVINSCIQFLPTLDGKQLLTVESLVDEDGRLHPVQQAMVDEHGSQCGFCTPGFVMSLFALYQETSEAPDRAGIDDALAGNLCRCTGYRPIVAAARAMYQAPRPEQDEQAVLGRLGSMTRQPPLTLQGGKNRFHAPRSLDELAELVVARPRACLLAGGTDVGLWVTKEHRELPELIYVGGVPELATVRQRDGCLDIGAAVTLTDAMPAMLAAYPELEELLKRFAGPPIRNAATLGGNIANGSPIGDTMPALLALGARLLLRRGATTRELLLDAFYTGYRETALEEGEFLERILIPLRQPAQHFRTYKISKRFDQDISAVCAAFCVELDDDRVASARIGFGGVAATPVRAPRCERALTGARWSETAVMEAATRLDEDFTPLTDMRATDGYRARVSRNLLRRFYRDVEAGGVPADVYRHGR